ncbi:MAG: hypothetical protein ACREMG_12930 [Gemmatimonadales bacterium]
MPKSVALARIGYAAMALATPKLASPFIGAKVGEVTPAAMGWAGYFASREAALGVLTLASEGCDSTSRRKVLLLNAAVDALDAVTAVLLTRRSRSIRPLLVALPAALMSVAAHVQEAQKLRYGMNGSGTPGSLAGAYATN